MAGGRAEDIQQLRMKQCGRAGEQAAEAAVPSPAPPHFTQANNQQTHAWKNVEKPTVAEGMQNFAEAQTNFAKAMGFLVLASA